CARDFGRWNGAFFEFW
nr:immunoglobulin heavy chain junction region [Macaca mulatta]MPN75492.1 immunoglobulin heavy chain junction region [Macaca mulatta]MPN79656.1 immunoglobulin heavy chain junction region [Macaca mulatta]